ncbi:Ketosteroid isomerase homolog [Parasphingorhabdus marina DSM 22363]|uniref:Ketosteroid isomerase homolog n=1 Tax=Parasphingorhabdus marina DSM 22363 TaxID=1123272 RepID=A0A1N6CMB6_9SPHN|nr:DUF4440 domain-containing protein [Parasphingorhabdus marina]SIN59748.1 Ketosteroid isomerase homolog [Parasphingorhabdus marina DSM 22363]
MKKYQLSCALLIASLPAATPVAANHAAAEAMAADTRLIIDWGTAWKRHFEAGDTEKLRDMYEPDAVLMANGAPPKTGVDDILEFLGRNKKAGNQVTIDFANEDITIDGKYGYLTARYWMTITPPGARPINVMGRSFLVYKKGDDGRWRLWRDMDNQAPDVRAEDRPGR